VHIVLIGWLWVILMIAVTANSIIAGVLIFLFLGIGPCLILLWLFGGRVRRRRLQGRESTNDATIAPSSVADELPHRPDRGNTETDQRKLRE
jgi:hypothetical protein